MDTSTSTIIEINGVKMEVDLRTAKAVRVDNFKVGSRVKILRKLSYGNEFSIHVGVIVGFDQFKALPSIRIAYLDPGYSGTPLKFFTFNAEVKDAEMLLADDGDLDFDRETIVSALARNIAAKRVELEQAELAERMFIKHFGNVIDLAQPAEIE